MNQLREREDDDVGLLQDREPWQVCKVHQKFRRKYYDWHRKSTLKITN
jgi:hypothetical protein